MTGLTTVVPFMGRDYKSKNEVLQAWSDGHDFIITDHFSRWDGKPINKEDADNSATDVRIRYSKLTKVLVIKHETKTKKEEETTDRST